MCLMVKKILFYKKNSQKSSSCYNFQYFVSKMGNALRRLHGSCCNPEITEETHNFVAPHKVSALAHDLQIFETTGQIPNGLSNHVKASQKTKESWYKKIHAAWKEAQVPPKNAEEEARLIVDALPRHRKADIEGILKFYGLPSPGPTPQSHKLELHTLEVNARDVADGDTVTVFVDTRSPKESGNVPNSVKEAVNKRRNARQKRDFKAADALRKEIEDAGYRIFDAFRPGEDILAKKYRVRLRGIDAPESKMPFGKEAKEALLNLVEGKSLRVLVYDIDRYNRNVGDIYADGVFVQESLLKKGLVWHYTAYDKRSEFTKWEQQARAARVGLWAQSKPEKPWEWRKNKREGGA